MTDKVIEFKGKVSGLVDETNVTIAIYGEDLDPDDISQQLGCQPTFSHRQGERRSHGSPPYKQGAWFLEVKGNAPHGPEDLTKALLMRLPADETIWVELARKHDIQMRYGIHMDTWNRGFELSPKLVQRISKLHAKLSFDIYAVGENDDA